MSGATGHEAIDRIYGHRFSDADAARKHALWREIGRYLQKFVPRDGVVLDLACDRGHFIANVEAREKWAADIRDVSGYLPSDVNFVQADGLRAAEMIPNDTFDLVFMSNYLEHLPSGEAVVRQLKTVAKLLKRGGCVVVVQPNIRLTGASYWDFIDHKVALTERSLVEAADLAGFEKEQLVARFLPYTTKSWLPQDPRLMRVYLWLRPLWPLFGKQTLYVGRRR